MGNMEATSFFAQLRRGKHGPIPRERSPSPVPIQEDPSPPEIVTIGDGSDDQSNSMGSAIDVLDADATTNSRSTKSSDPEKPVINNSILTPALGLMNLPFPPGMEGMNKNNVGILPPHLKLYDNLLGASEALKISMKKQKVSITKDLPMPPGT